MSIILASKSPRRQELLKLLGLEFTVHTADIDEHMDPSLPPEQEVARVSAEKARAVAKNCAEEDIIISADTIVVIDGQILGKPKSEADAIRMLNLLSGRRHEVMTGLTVLSGGQSQTRVVRTGIEFRRLTDREIDAYVATGEPMDKAGAYGIQGRASIFVSHLDGDYFCVMGLPVCTLTQMLRERGVTVLGCAGHHKAAPLRRMR